MPSFKINGCLFFSFIFLQFTLGEQFPILGDRYPVLERGRLGSLLDKQMSLDLRSEPFLNEELRQKTLDYWAHIPILHKESNHPEPRAILARLELEVDLENANQSLCLIQPHECGSGWDIREAFGFKKGSFKYRIGHRGDYDFTAITLIQILYKYSSRPNILYPQTVDWAVENLFPFKGQPPRRAAPRSLELFEETENHLLMTEGSRYLINQFIFRKSPEMIAFDNQKNGMTKWLESFLSEIQNSSFYEYNSIPYIGYSMQALLTLEAYAESPQIRDQARNLLDRLNMTYALGSLDFRRYPPFHRQKQYAQSPSLIADRHTDLFTLWNSSAQNSLNPELEKQVTRSSLSLIAATSSYRLPDSVRNFLKNRNQFEYYLQLGRGTIGSPEIYSGGPGYLITAGGVARRSPNHEMVARPTTLLLEDGAIRLEDCFYIPGNPEKFNSWNQMGVALGFACGNQPVSIPKNYSPILEKGNWKLFKDLSQNLFWTVYNQKEFGLLIILPETNESPQETFMKIIDQNSDSQLKNEFHFPGERKPIQYNLNAPIGQSVITSGSGINSSANYDSWPQFDGYFIDLKKNKENFFIQEPNDLILRK